MDNPYVDQSRADDELFPRLERVAVLSKHYLYPQRLDDVRTGFVRL